MSVHVVVSPYDSGHQGRRMGAGPDAFLKHGIENVLRAAGKKVETGRVAVDTEFPTEVATSLTVAAHIASHAGEGIREDRVPLVLSGNCSAALGGVDAMARRRDGPIGVLWLDAHGDFNTPETSTTGFLDGMSLAMLTGRCWRPAVTEAMGHWWQPVPEENVVLAGTRDLDAAEEEALRQSRVHHVPGGDGERTVRELDGVLRTLQHDIPNLYVHLDCDVVDTSVGRANRFACPGGLTGPQLERVMRMVRERFRVGAMGISAYDPAFDRDGAVYRAVSGAARALLA